MQNDIRVPKFLVSAVQQRTIEINGLLALIRFALSTHHNYFIPEEKINVLYEEYFKTVAELGLLKTILENKYIQNKEKVFNWKLNYETGIIEFDNITERKYYDYEDRIAFPQENYGDTLQNIYNYNEAYKDRKVLAATFQVTEACSLACTYCYQHNKSPKVMTLDVAKKYVDVIFNTYPKTHYCITLDFIGGEPLLQPKLISDIVDYWDYKCIMENLEWGKLSRFSICTNGTEYKNKECQKLISKLGYRVSFTVSIDGNKELHDSARIFPNGKGSYDLAVDAAQDFEKRFNQDLGSKMTIAPSNIIFLYPAIKHYLDSGKRIIFANCVYEEGWTYDDAKLFYNELKKVADYTLENYPKAYLSIFDEGGFEPMDEEDNQNWCGGNGLMLACDPEGILYPCLRYMPSSLGENQKPLTCGHVDTSIDTQVLDDMQQITRRSQSTDECFYCPIAKGCSWCSAYNYEVFGTVNKRATFICPMHKARALANVYYWNKYYQLKGLNKTKKNNCPKEWALEIIDEKEYEMLNSLAQWC